MRWGEKDTCHFVKLYLSHRILWDYKLPGYKCKQDRHKAYSLLIADFKNATGISITETECKAKIKNLRSTYSQEVAKIRNRSGPDFVFRPSIRWFSAWHKCFRKANSKKSEEDTAYDNEETAEDSCQKAWVDDDINDNENGKSEPFASEDFMLVLKPEPDESPVKPETQSSYKIKRRKIKRSTSTDNSDRSYRGSIESMSTYKEDEFDIYGKYIASQLRKMDAQKALRLQLEIQSLVSKARISDLAG